MVPLSELIGSTTLSLSLLVVCCQLHAQQPKMTVLWEIRDTRYLVQRIEVSDVQIAAEAIASSILRQNGDKSFLSLQFVTATTDSCFFDPKLHHLWYSGWRSLFQQCRTTLPELAEVVRWRGGTVLRQRIGDRVTTKIMNGIDPLKVRVGSLTINICFFAVPRGPGWSSRPRIDVFATSPSPLSRTEIDKFKQVFESISATLPFPEVNLYIESDGWFVLIPTFPVQGPFLTAQPSPSEEDVSQSRSIRCSSWRKEVCVVEP